MMSLTNHGMDSPSDQNIWQYKPWWCQPWSILLTGVTIVVGSWLIFHRLWVTLLVAAPIVAWMGFFLVVYPRMMREALMGESRSDQER